METHAVTVRGLRKAYEGRPVLDGVDFHVGHGEIVGLIGANGAGKTTAVECLQGLRRPDAGALRVLGYDRTTEIDKIRPLLGSQLQDSGLPDRLRVSEALDLFATRRAVDGGSLLERFGLSHVRRSAFSALSGGERQRLFLVLALLNRPRLVILDELTQGLDAAGRRNVWEAIHEARDLGTTVLLVTHYLDEAEVLCDRVVAMRAGRVLDQGTPAEMVARHAPGATMSFPRRDAEPGAGDLIAELRRLPGVASVAVGGDRVEIQGDRSSVAHVGAALVQRGHVPDDLHVAMPDLEAALLRLLSSQDDEAAGGGAAPLPANPPADRSASFMIGACS